MIYTWELSAANAERNKSVGRIMIGLLAPVAVFTVGMCLFGGGVKQGNAFCWIIGLVLTAASIGAGFLLLKKLLEVRNKVYKLFAENDVFVETPACSGTEQLALDKFHGELKPALRYIAETPELFFRERCDYIAEWKDYEKDYVREYFGKDPLCVASSNKTRALTLEKIEEDGVSLGEEDNFQLVKDFCRQKTQPSYLVDGDEQYRLYFWECGSYECTAALYNQTNVGHGFYIVMGRYSGKICLVYPMRDWHLDEDLLELVQ